MKKITISEEMAIAITKCNPGAFQTLEKVEEMAYIWDAEIQEVYMTKNNTEYFLGYWITL